MPDDLKVSLGVDTSSLATGLERAKSQIAGFAASVGPMLAAAVSVGGIAYAVKSIADMAGQIKDAADATGLGVESFQRLSGAFSEGGVSSGKFTQALAKLNDTIGNAAAGNEQAQSTLARLGITLADLASITPEQALMKVSDTISGINDPAERARLAIDLFGKAGAAMIPTLQGGSAALQDAAGKFSAFSTEVITSIDSASERVDRFMMKLKSLPVLIVEGLQDLAGFYEETKRADMIADLLKSPKPVERKLGEQLARQELKTASKPASAVSRQVAPTGAASDVVLGPGNAQGIKEWMDVQDRAAVAADRAADAEQRKAIAAREAAEAARLGADAAEEQNRFVKMTTSEQIAALRDRRAANDLAMSIVNSTQEEWENMRKVSAELTGQIDQLEQKLEAERNVAQEAMRDRQEEGADYLQATPSERRERRRAAQDRRRATSKAARMFADNGSAAPTSAADGIDIFDGPDPRGRTALDPEVKAPGESFEARLDQQRNETPEKKLEDIRKILNDRLPKKAV